MKGGLPLAIWSVTLFLPQYVASSTYFVPNLHGHGPAGRPVATSGVHYVYDLPLWPVGVLAFGLAVAAVMASDRGVGRRWCQALACVAAVGWIGWSGVGFLGDGIFHTVRPRPAMVLAGLSAIGVAISQWRVT